MRERGLIRKILNADRVQDHDIFYRAILKGTYIDVIEANKKLREENFRIQGVIIIGMYLAVDVIKK